MAKDTTLKKRLGSDAKFPIEGSFASVDGVELLVQDIEQLLLTIPGERPFRPSYGCNLRNQLWEDLDEAAIAGSASIRNALDEFEPRITVTSIAYSINRNTSLITYKIQFIIKSNDTSFNLVFPFRAGTSLSFN